MNYKLDNGVNNYQNEVDSFRKKFISFTEQRVVIYGIGRRTATLIPYLKDFNIVGLMDRDKDNIGKVMYGLPIISLHAAEDVADIIIINAPQSYWEIIYKRISNAKIPVYYCNGEIAQSIIIDDSYCNNPYWDQSLEVLYDKASEYEIISFDLFDTLITRRVYLPQDVWSIVEKKCFIEKNINLNFNQLRKQAISEAKVNNPNIHEIYNSLKNLTKLEDSLIENIIELEFEIEESLIIPRVEMVELFKKLKNDGKDIYILTDIHLPFNFLKKILNKFQINVDDNKLWISNAKRVSKNNGDMWVKYGTEVVGGRKSLHIGDDIYSDIRQAEKYGIDTYHVMAGSDMLNNSSIKKVVTKICSEYASIIAGLFISNNFNNPFELNSWKGKLYFGTEYNLGYGLFGPVIYTYLRWIEEKVMTEGIEQLYFLARDGYFLYENYKYLSQIRGYGVNCDYLEISRRAVMVPSVQSEQDLEDVIRFPYNGTFSDYLEDRFSIIADTRTKDYNEKWISTVNDYEQVYELCLKYFEEIKRQIYDERNNYLNYLDSKEMKEKCGFVDLFFYGNTQYYLSKLLNKKLIGFYMACDLSPSNRCNANNILFPCFQDELDSKAKNCNILKKCLLLESFLTAPNGMLLRIDTNGKFVYSSDGNNQKYFINRKEINQGVKSFIKDATKSLTGKEKVDTRFIDDLYGELLNNNFILSERLKEIFYFDNALIQRRELKIMD